MASTSSSSARLIDDEGEITEQFEQCLKHIFCKYASNVPEKPSDLPSSAIWAPEDLKRAFLSDPSLDAWATDTNGEPFSEATKQELFEFMDLTEDGKLTWKGFLQVYQLQTENDEEETWKDLRKHGFNRQLSLGAASD